MKHYSWKKDNFLVSTDTQLLDINAIHHFLTHSHWAKGISKEAVRQIGFARVITDYVTFGYVCDVYVIEAYRKQGLGKWLMECCHQHPSIQGLRRLLLITSSAPWLYQRMGYMPVNKPNYIWQKQ
ncbi:MAG: N-acetyltransferase [Gammaproteobacteria bacterium]|nr:MAG: N-acetyltransferase [Gammaproteobacteria bacterium]